MAAAAGGGDVVFFKYPAMTKSGAAGFKLNVVQGEFRGSEVIVLLGARGTGKTTFLRLLRGSITPLTCSQVMEPLQINQLMDKRFCDLSADEVQTFKFCVCLGRNAHIYLIDEPSVNLSPQQRIVAAEVIKRYIQHSNKTAFVVENDFAMVEHLADKVILFEGTPSVNCVAHAPQPWNLFLAGGGQMLWD